MSTPSFSIIIPHFNIPDLLMRCLKSIPVSEDILVIVVDDNSPDADTYLERYPELRRPYLEFIRTSKGGGAGYARNVGLNHARGKWLLFADADDLYVDNMYDIVKSYVDSNADVIFFKEKSVLSNDINKTIKRLDYINQYIDDYIETGYDKYVRLRYCNPWGKMIRREFVEKYQFRFDEIDFSNDYFFSICTGYYARNIEVDNQVLYIYTYRDDSLSGVFCSKSNELRIRSEVSFRVGKIFNSLGVDIEQQRPFKWYLCEMLKRDRELYAYYFERLDEIYPSRYVALKDIGDKRSLNFKLFLYFYSLLLWLKRLIS